MISALSRPWQSVRRRARLISRRRYGLDVNVFFGRVAYTHGVGLDRPLSVVRFDYADSVVNRPFVRWGPFSLVPHWNLRGEADNGSFADGALSKCTIVGGVTRCVQVRWPFGWTATAQQAFTRDLWHGSLLEDKRDGSGLLFRRNRYMDPATGRFTQEDPIGLAGGLNLYGFADGDPVNFSDPFGLCPQCEAAGVMVFVAMASRALDPVNERRIAQLAPGVQTSARLFVNYSAAAGAPIRITQGLRTFGEQDELYAQGRTRPGPRVTNARGGQSYHNYGLAIDVAPVENGRPNPGRYPNDRTVGVGTALGWEWGGGWTTFQDRPHFQMTGGRTWQQLCAETVGPNSPRCGR